MVSRTAVNMEDGSCGFSAMKDVYALSIPTFHTK